MYTFIHPTKTGGSACDKYFMTYYSKYFNGSCFHKIKCSDDNNPVIIIRDPIDRFISMYKYWKYGPIDRAFKRGAAFIEKYNNYSIKDFINLLKTNSTKDLYQKFTWDAHFKPQNDWIDNTQYNNIIIIKYDANLNDNVQKLIKFLKLEADTDTITELSFYNISKNIEQIILDDTDIEFIKQRYNDDYILIDKINNNPELFKFISA